MPLQNRCDPAGRLHAVAARGALTGNRGRLIRPDGSIRPEGGIRARISCVLSFRGRRRDPVGPGYTNVFFLDEWTALAAGHRPCFECRRQDAQRLLALSGHSRAPDLDRALRAAARAPVHERKVPDGTITWRGGFFLIWAGAAHRWSFEGYGPPQPLAEATAVTPAPLRRALAHGYSPS